METAEFTWPSDPPADWWESEGAVRGLAPEQVRFAAALFLLGGPESRKNSVAAKLAGLNIGRTQAFRCARSVGVRKLLDEPNSAKAGKREPISEDEIDQIIERLIRSPDAAQAARGIELRERRKQAAAAAAQSEALREPQEIAREILTACPRSMAPGFYLGLILPGMRWHAPWIREFAPYLAAHYPAEWRACRASLAGEFNQMSGECDRLERYPLLTLDEIMERVGSAPLAVRYTNGEALADAAEA
jgi:hypothetical protein